MIKAVIFDVFGTLVHKKGSQMSAYKEVARHAIQNGCSGNPLKECLVENRPFAEFARKYGLDETSIGKFENLIKEDVATAGLYDDVDEVMRNLRNGGVKIALISNLVQPYAIPRGSFWREWPMPSFFPAKKGLQNRMRESTNSLLNALG